MNQAISVTHVDHPTAKSEVEVCVSERVFRKAQGEAENWNSGMD